MMFIPRPRFTLAISSIFSTITLSLLLISCILIIITSFKILLILFFLPIIKFTCTMHDMPVTIVRIYVELINIKQFTILSRCLKVWKPLLSDVTLSHRYSSLKIFKNCQSRGCYTVNSLLRGQLRELEKVSASRAIHLRVLFT